MKKVFTGYTRPDGEFVAVAKDEWTTEEKAWVKSMDATLKHITGKAGYETWASGGPDLGHLGRGEDRLTVRDTPESVAA